MEQAVLYITYIILGMVKEIVFSKTLPGIRDAEVPTFAPFCSLNMTHGEKLLSTFAPFEEEVMKSLNIKNTVQPPLEFIIKKDVDPTPVGHVNAIPL